MSQYYNKLELMFVFGYLEEIKKVWEKDKFYIHEDDEGFFKLACNNNKLECAKWLWEKSLEIKSPINICSDDCGVFRWGCRDGNYDVVTWLWEISNQSGQPINIRVDNDYAFLESCKNYRLNVAYWLCELYSGYSIYTGNNMIEYKISDNPKKNFELYDETEFIHI
jgi:hypothetical protein